MSEMRLMPSEEMDADEWARWGDGQVVDAANKVLRCTGLWATHPEDSAPTDPASLVIGGCGVFVKGQWGQGVLTAAHCLDERAGGRGGSGRSIAPMGGPNGKPLQGLVVAREMLQRTLGRWEKEKEREGPDIAFVPLPKWQMREIEGQSEGVFLNLDRQQAGPEIEGSPGVLMAIGHVAGDGEEAERRHPHPSGRGSVVVRVAHMQMPDGEECYTRNGWGLMRLEPTERGDEAPHLFDLEEGIPDWLRELTIAEPGSWRGMSGGGVWWMGRPAGSRGPMTAVLFGILFYEEEGEDGKRRLYGHDRRSIERMVHEIKEARLDYTEALVVPLG